MNTVIAGDYKGKMLQVTARGKLQIYINARDRVDINKDTTERYEIQGKDTQTKFSYGKAAMGAVVFGDVGVIAGAGKKQKNTYQVAVYFRDGKSSLLEMNDEYYRILVEELFNVENYDVAAAREITKRENMEKAKKKSRSKSIILGIFIFIAVFVICAIVASPFCPKVDGVIQFGGLPFAISFLVSFILAVLIPVLLNKKK